MEAEHQTLIMIRIKLITIIGVFLMLFGSCERANKGVLMPDGKVYHNPTIKSLQESDYSVVFIPYSGYSIPTFKDTIFANSYLILKGESYYFGESEVSENTEVEGFATIVNPDTSLETIVESLTNEISIQLNIIESKIVNKNKAQIIFDESIMLEIEKEKGVLFCRTMKH